MTYWSSQDNYGQQLQMYALYTYLVSQGHDVFAIKYDGISDTTLKISNTERFKRRLKRIIKMILFEPKTIISTIKRKISKQASDITPEIVDSGFERFRENRYQWSQQYNSYAELCSNPPSADVYICGSDMIWNNSPRYKPFFLEFVKSGKKIAYAPSFGSAEIAESYKRKIRPLMKSFDAISMREKTGVDICKSMGFDNAKWVPDPTTLLNKCDYEAIEIKPQTDNKYIFMYLLGHETDIPFDDINIFAKNNKMELYYRASQKRYDALPKVYPSVEEWLGYMNHAEYIITNSFHGCVISIIMNKKFIYLPIVGVLRSINARAFSFLDRLNLNDRIWGGDINIISNDINYASATKSLKEWADEAKSYLKDNIPHSL